MGKRAPNLPVASAEREKVTIVDGDWRRIESAYGRKLSPEARRDIHERTQEFVDRAEFEQNAEPVSHALDRISAIIGAASSLRSALDGGNDDADIHARTLIKKHFRSVDRPGAAEICVEIAVPRAAEGERDDPLRGISGDMRLLILASQDAQEELNNTKDEGFKEGEAWDRWIGRLTSIAKQHGLPCGARKDSDKQFRSSPFVELVWELQKFVPKAHRRDHSKGALAVAIGAARK